MKPLLLIVVALCSHLAPTAVHAQSALPAAAPAAAPASSGDANVDMQPADSGGPRPQVLGKGGAALEDPADGAAAAGVTLSDGSPLQQLQDQLSALQEAGLSEGDLSQAADNYKKAIELEAVAQQRLAQAESFETKRAALKPSTAAEGADPTAAEQESEKQKKSRLGAIAYAKASLAETLPSNASLADLSLEELEAEAAAAEQATSEYRAAEERWRTEPANRQNRATQITDDSAAAKSQAAQTAEQLSQPQPEGVSEAAWLSRRARLRARLRASEATLYALDREQAYYRESAALIQPSLDDASRRRVYQEQRLAQLRNEINRRRQLAADEQAREAERDAKVARPEAIANLANENARLAQIDKEVLEKLALIRKELDTANDLRDGLDEEFRVTREKLGVGELSNALGELLRNQQDKLPDVRALKRRRALRNAEKSEFQRDLYEMTSRRADLAAIDEAVDEAVELLPNPTAEDEDEVRRLLEAERKLLDDLIKDFGRYTSDLDELEAAESQIQSTSEQYRNFIAERVLWIRSAEMLHPRDAQPVIDATAWSLDPRNWADAGMAVYHGCRRRPFEASLFIVAFAGLLYAQRPARRRLRDLGEAARKRTCVDLHLTLQALWLTAVVALPWPALLVYAGRVMDSPLNESEFVRSLSSSIQFTAVCLLLLDFLRQLCRPLGLADAHFNWPDSCLAQVRRQMRWLIALSAPLILWIAGLEQQRQEPLWNSSLGRLCFIGLLAGVTAALHSLLIKAKSPVRKLLLDHTTGWLAPLASVWRPTCAYLPAALALLAASGYYYTAQHAAVRVLQTAALMVGVLVLGGLTRRWLLVNRRRLARKQAMQRRAQLTAGEHDAAVMPEVAADDAVDLAALSEQTQKLVRSMLAVVAAIGLYLIWNEILPALAFIDSPIPGLGQLETPLTWGSLLLFAVILAITYLSVRDIPAVLEVVVLQKLPLDGGSRYALSTISRYVLAAVGLVAAYRTLGFTGRNIQWLIAAMGVGLGFGLQEIFANFVSGIILLFERPIRVGDIVTLGEKTGVVSRIRMRATTIVDWDRKEYIVPNKDLMTDRLLNWTLSDLTNRIVIEVGVSYGGDTDRAIQLMLEAAAEHPLILADPPPIATFEGFGDSSLKLLLRCFLPNMENRLPTITDLHLAIDRKFRAAGVEIPFPQRDLHVRSTPADSAAHAEHRGRSDVDEIDMNLAHASSADADERRVG